MNRLTLFIPLAVFLLLGVYFGLGLTRNPSELRSVLIDKPSPSFDLPVPEDNVKRFTTAQHSGRVTLLNVFAS